MAEKKTWRPVLDYDKEVADKIIWLCEHINELNLNEDAMKSNENVITVESDEELNISETVSDYLSQTNHGDDDSVVIKKYAVDVLQNFALHCKNANPNNYEELLSLSGSFDIFPDEHKSLFESYIKDMGIYYESCKKCISHLDNVGDGLFRTILKLVCHPKFKYELGYHLEKKTVVINSNVKYLCGKLNLDYNVFGSLLDNDDPEYNGIKIFSDSLYINDSTNRALCIGLKTDKSGVPVCPRCYYTLMAAICISHSYNLFDGYLKKRVDRGTTYYPFEWKPKDGLKKIPQHLFDLAVALEENGLIRVNPELGMSVGKHGTNKSKLKSDKLYIDLYNADCDFMRSYNSSEDISKLLPINKRTFKLFKSTGLEDALYVNDGYSSCGYSCRKECCVALVAGYIHYLRVTNQMHILDEDREYYKNNESVVLDEINKLHSEMVDKFNEKQTSKLFESDLGKTLMEYSDRAEGIEDLVITLSGKSNSIYGVIEAEKGLHEDYFLSDLVEGLVNADMVSVHNKTIMIPPPTPTNSDFSFSRGDIFSPFLASLNLKIKPYGNPFQDKAERWWQTYLVPNVEILSLHNLANVLSVSLTAKNISLKSDNVDGTFNAKGEHVELGIGHYNLKKNGLYIVNGIREFLTLYRKSEDYKDMGKMRNLYDYMIEMLCNYNKQVKFFLCGTAEELKDLFALDPRIAQIYGLRVKFKPLSVETLFENYKKNLEPKVYDMLYMERDFYSRFENYIADNRSLMAFKNYDLCSYLSAYSNQNSVDKVELPPDLYKRRTLEESLSTIIGLNSVKKKVYEFEAFSRYYSRAKALGLSLPKQNMHMVFTGNPGCGKTTIARIMAKMLYDIGLLKEDKLIEVDRKDLIGQYLGQTAPKTHEVVEKAMGGVLFIDEAYSLTAKNGTSGFDMYGQEAIATLIKDMEDRKGEFVVIFAGYKDEMKTFVDSNPGISSRIGYTFDFEDYSVLELIEIFKLKASLSGLRYDEDCISEVERITTYFKSRKNFGNGRFVDKLLQECIVRHSVRLGGDNSDLSSFDLLSVEDMPSIEDLTCSYSNVSKTAHDELDSLIGLGLLKQRIYDFEDFVLYSELARKQGIKVAAQNYHMLFTGNPGTGKTTVARIVARMLFDAGVLHENKVIEVDRKDLVGDHAGTSAPKTAEVIEKALGGVLFIDEAYSLYNSIHDSLGLETIATLIKAMEDHKGEFVVIFAGYKDEMKTFIDSNAGIASRIGYTFDFPDYSTSELLDIYKLKMMKSGYNLDSEIDAELLKICSYFRLKKNFGNGRFVDKLVQDTLLKHSKYCKEDDFVLVNISLRDIPSIEELVGHQTEKSVEASELLNSLIGLEPIKKSMTDFENFVLFGEEAKKKGLKVPSQNLHMLFTGNPGCGKTTVARIVARILFDAGILHENKVIEVERKDLVGQFLGQTAPKTSEVIDRALGGVLFIDEAYSLTPENKYDMYGQEAISTLIKAMEDHKGEFVVILAGYKKEMKTFIDSNSGIASRIGYSFDFPDYSAEELQQIFMLKMKKSGFTVSKEAEEKVLKLTKFFAGVENIGNGRFVDKIVQDTLLTHSRIKSDDISVITEKAIPSIQEMSDSVYSVSGFINPDNIKVKKLRKTAIHELGHAISSMILYEEPRIKNITINPEGRGSLGCTVFMVDADDYTHSKSELIKKMMVLLGGLANEEVVLGEFESGGTSDLGKCTAICNDMITRFGMSSLGFCQLNPNNQGVSAIILEESNKILNDCFADVKTILSEYKDKTLLAVDYLMEYRDMSEEKLREILFDSSPVKDEKGNIVINASKFDRD